MKDDELKPCPFCGGRAQMRLDHDHSTAWLVECLTKPSCPIHDREIYGLTKSAAISSWNTRLETSPREDERVREALDAKRYRWLREGNAGAPERGLIAGGEALDQLCDRGLALNLKSCDDCHVG